YGPPRAVDLVGELDPGGRSAHYQDATSRQPIRTAVVKSRDAFNLGRHRLLHRRHMRYVGGTTRQDDAAAMKLAVTRRNVITAVGAADGSHGRVRAYRCRDRLRKTRDGLDDLRHRHVAVRIVAAVWITGQSALPIRRQQAQRIPALATPGV